jgi:membrane protein DedA with SNARE-associated domain
MNNWQQVSVYLLGVLVGTMLGYSFGKKGGKQ